MSSIIMEGAYLSGYYMARGVTLNSDIYCPFPVIGHECINWPDLPIS